ncbi:MAG TPA: hypothetical protein PLM29_01780 [Deltaproteobacteria bacterium]|nr:hypothetical protein [Deltaproteobacteria bacterium]
MRYFKAAVAAAILSIICITSSYGYFRSGQIRLEHYQKRYTDVIRMKSERELYKDKVEVLKKCGQELAAISKDIRTNVDYDITLCDHDIEALHSQIISTYAEGIFFLESATIESGSKGIRLAVKGFKMGENSHEN